MNNRIKTIGFLFVFPIFWFKYRTIKKQLPVIKNSIETLDELIRSKKSFARFGDGELNLISGLSIGFQKADDELVRELIRVLTCPNRYCYIGLPYSLSSLNNFRFDAKCFWLYSIVKNWKRWRQYCTRESYLDTQCSRFYMDIKDKSISKMIVKKWKELWQNRDTVIIEGENTKMGVGNDLFAGAKSLRRIVCPSKNAFSVYDRILECAQQLSEDNLILIALGPTASVLAYDLSLSGYQAIDTGHLDLEYNWMQCNAENKIPVAGRSVNELKSSHLEEIYDQSYDSQIICRVYSK